MYPHVIEMSIFQECPQATVVFEYSIPALVINSDRLYYLQATTNVQRVHSGQLMSLCQPLRSADGVRVVTVPPSIL